MLLHPVPWPNRLLLCGVQCLGLTVPQSASSELTYQLRDHMQCEHVFGASGMGWLCPCALTAHCAGHSLQSPLFGSLALLFLSLVCL